MKNRLESTKEANGHALDPCTKTKSNFAIELKCLLKSAKSSTANVSKYKRILISHMTEARDFYAILFWTESDAFFAFHIWFFFTFNCKKRGQMLFVVASFKSQFSPETCPPLIQQQQPVLHSCTQTTGQTLFWSVRIVQFSLV